MYGVNSMVKDTKIIKFKHFGKRYELEIDWTSNYLELALYDEAALNVDRDSMLQSVNLDTDPIWSDSVELLDD